jgi:hypothetical protein
MQYEVHVRWKGHVKRRGQNHGPDTYVAVTEAPDGVKVPYALNSRVLEKRGITLHYFGEGYRDHNGPRSKLGQAIARADDFVRQCREAEAD